MNASYTEFPGRHFPNEIPFLALLICDTDYNGIGYLIILHIEATNQKINMLVQIAFSINRLEELDFA